MRFLVFFVFFIQFIYGDSVKEENPPFFVVLSFPRSHADVLIETIFLLNNFSETKNIDDLVNASQMLKEKKYLHCEFSEKESQFLLSHQHENPLKIILVRDLRNVFISFVHFYDSLNEKIRFVKWKFLDVSYYASFEKKLDALLTQDFSVNSSNLLVNLDNAVFWKKGENTVFIQLENLMGSKEKQKEIVLQLANALHVKLSENKLKHILKHLKERRPSIENLGPLDKNYTEEQKQLFNERFGVYQNLLEYESFGQ